MEALAEEGDLRESIPENELVAALAANGRSPETTGMLVQLLRTQLCALCLLDFTPRSPLADQSISDTLKRELREELDGLRYEERHQFERCALLPELRRQQRVKANTLKDAVGAGREKRPGILQRQGWKLEP